MRTTITLDDDVYQLLCRLSEREKVAFKKVVNDALRAGLAQISKPARPSRARYRTPAVSLGKPRLPSLDSIEEVLAVAEGEDHP